jgi:hypothetical protein
MTNEIPKQNWKLFFDDASRDYLQWETRVEVLKEDIGAQILSEGLSLVGFVFEEKTVENGGEQSNVEIIIGEESGVHQTHTIFNPRVVAFLHKEDGTHGGTIEIEDAGNAKTLIHLVQPISVQAAYSKLGKSASGITTANFGE